MPSSKKGKTTTSVPRETPSSTQQRDCDLEALFMEALEGFASSPPLPAAPIPQQHQHDGDGDSKKDEGNHSHGGHDTGVESALLQSLLKSHIGECVGRMGRMETNQERMDIVDIYFKDFVDDYFHTKMKSATSFKDSTIAITWREKGNMAFRQDDFNTSVELYARAIAVAPAESKELAMGYANRSAALRQLKRWPECLADVRCALDMPAYPKELRPKLVERRGDAEKQIRFLDQWQPGRSKKSKKGRQLNRVMHQAADPARMDEVLESEEHRRTTDCDTVLFRDPPSLSYGPSSESPNLSAAVRIQYSAQRGQHLVAARDINIGDVVSVEPFLCGLQEDRRYMFCAHCFKRCFCLLPCDNCNWAMFCETKCRSEAARYHGAECAAFSRFLLLEEQFGKEGYAMLLMRVIAQCSLASLQAFLGWWKRQEGVGHATSSEQQRRRGFNPNGRFVSSDVYTICQLASKVSQRAPEAVFHHALQVLELVRCMEEDGNTISPELQVLFLRIFFIIHQNENIYSIMEYHRSYKDYVKVGVTLAPASTLASRACNPNCMYAFYGTRKVVIAITPIPKGAPLTYSLYGDYLSSGRLERRALMRRRGKPECRCEACLHDWPPMDGMPTEPSRTLPPPEDPKKFETAKFHLLHINHLCPEVMIEARRDSAKVLVSYWHRHGEVVNRHYAFSLNTIIESYLYEGNAVYLPTNPTDPSDVFMQDTPISPFNMPNQCPTQ